MTTFDIINPKEYTTGKEEQRINPTALNRSHNIIRINEQIENEFHKICSQINFKEKRSLNQKNERRNKR